MERRQEVKSKAPTSRYERLIEAVFDAAYAKGASSVAFSRDDLIRHAKRLRIVVPKNLGDIIYTFRHRNSLPASIARRAPAGSTWMIVGTGRGTYAFESAASDRVIPNSHMAQTRIPDSTPGVITRYALSDEQATLAKIRYNRLLDIFTGVVCTSLQSHLRSTVKGIGQIEVDELYIGIDQAGAHTVIPIQAKGGKDQIGLVQIRQDIALCAAKFPALTCRAIAAQTMSDDSIALFEFVQTQRGVRVSQERHYKLVPQEEITESELIEYTKLSKSSAR
jgi:hypothetical protein